MANNNPVKKFTKNDTRINRNGRPKDTLKLKKLAQIISHEIATDDDGGEMTANGSLITRIESILRDWSSSKDFQKQKQFVEYAYGKPKDDTSENNNVITVVYTNDY